MEDTLEAGAPDDPAMAQTSPVADEDRPRLVEHQPVRVGRFTVLEELGRGGMGIVYAAYDPDLDRKVAVKVIRGAVGDRSQETSEGRARLLREAQAMARLSHPNVATVHEVGMVGQQVFLAMEFIKGRTLKAWVADVAGPEGWPAIVQIYRQAGEGLAAAHRAGLIHRDFKPDNVLVDAQGRARVLDFGLARAELQDEPHGSSEPVPMEVSGDLYTPLTMAGAVMGTPAYMAPEQFMGEVCDARSDQFSFCASLWEALYGERPFQGSTFVELRQRVLRGGPPEAPEHTAVPAWLHRVLLRGMGRHPAERYDSMEDLLDALGRDPRRTKRAWRWGAAGALLLVGVVGTAVYVQGQLEQARVPEEPCAHPQAELRGIWDVDRKRQIRDAFTETKVGYAEGTWERVQTGLDDYAQRFTEASGAVCRATEVEGTQPEALRLVRQACLSRRLSELRAYTAVFARADPEVVQGAVAGIDTLRDPDECRTVQTMRVEMPLPVDEEAAAQVVEHRQRLDDVMALIVSGKRDEAQKLAQQVVIDAEQLAYLPFIAEAQLKLGITLDKKGRYEQAAQALGKALTAAEVGRHDAAAVDAWNEWLRTVGFHQGHHQVARATLPRLDAALQRLGDDPLREAAVHKTRGTLAYAEGDFAAAVEHFESGQTVLERELGPDHSQTAILYQNLGTALNQLGRYDEAEAVLQKGLRIWSAHSGSQHPGLASIHESLGNLARGRDNAEAAVKHFALALELFEQSHDELHPELAVRYRDLGWAHGDAGHHDEAAKWHRKALEAERARLRGPEPPFTSSLALARALLASGRAQEAIAPLETVRAHPQADQAEPEVSFVLAQVLWRSGSRARARSLATAARDGYRERGQTEAQATVERWLAEHRSG